MALIFKGQITEILNKRNGSTEKGEWASCEFEVTESEPENTSYPQIAKFDIFKNGEHIKYAKDFETYYPLNSIVEVEFNLKKNEYTNKESQLVGFYKTSAWKITKISDPEIKQESHFNTIDEINEKDHDDMPF